VSDLEDEIDKLFKAAVTPEQKQEFWAADQPRYAARQPRRLQTRLVRAFIFLGRPLTDRELAAWVYDGERKRWWTKNVRRSCKQYGWKLDGDKWIAPSSWRRAPSA
jgi:hypothetical protein